jgi:hypothetical protein
MPVPLYRPGGRRSRVPGMQRSRTGATKPGRGARSLTRHQVPARAAATQPLASRHDLDHPQALASRRTLDTHRRPPTAGAGPPAPAPAGRRSARLGAAGPSRPAPGRGVAGPAAPLRPGLRPPPGTAALPLLTRARAHRPPRLPRARHRPRAAWPGIPPAALSTNSQKLCGSRSSRGTCTNAALSARSA